MTRRPTLTPAGRLVLAALVLAGLGFAGTAHAQDPGATGPFAVTVEEYNFGDTAFTPSGGFPSVEVRGSVHYPTGLAGGPYPVVVLLHGRHATCYQGGSAFLQWPCSAGRSPIPSYQGYHYFSEKLASHGYIVISISANGINAFDNGFFDLGMSARAELVQHHLDRWNTFNTSGGSPFGSKFVGKLDLQNVGTMGHSRGGEGVASNFLLNRSLGEPYGIQAVFPLAPVDFLRPVVDGVALKVLLPYCDGDVSDLQGVHFYDDARYTFPGDLAPKHYMLVMGANHNYYNTVWTPGLFPAGAGDDWGARGDPFCDSGQPTRLTPAEQRGTGLAYMAAFFRTYLGGETAFVDILRGDAAAPPSAMGADIYLSYHAEDSPTTRRDVNRLLDASGRTVNTLGGSVTRSGFTPYDMCGGAGQTTPCLPTQPNSRQPHTTPSARSSAPGLSQLRAGWSAATATWVNNLPVGSRDVSGFRVLQFRAGVNFEDSRTVAGQPLNFVVRLTDGTGATADVEVASHSGALFYPPGLASAVPKVVLHTIRLPLSAFAGVDRSNIQSIQFRFERTASGALLLADLAFADPSGVVADPPDLIVSSLGDPPASSSAGSSFTANDTVTNQGAGSAGGSTTRYYLSLDASKSGGDTLLTGSRAVAPLSPGAVSSGSTLVTIPGIAAGNYFLIACADDTTTVTESVENNNCRASTTQVTIAVAGQPDLGVSAVTNPPATIVLGQTFAITDTTANTGGGQAGATTTRFYLSLDQVRGNDKKVKGDRAVPPLAGGASSSGATTVTVTAAVPRGTYFLIACADDLKVVPEANEGNNCRVSSTTVQVFAADLVETAVSNPPVTASGGTIFSVTDTVRNNGDASAGASTTRYYLSADTTRDGSDTRLLGDRPVPGLAPSATNSGTASVAVPPGMPSGTYRLLACADDKNKVVESGGKNNCRASTTTVVVP